MHVFINAIDRSQAESAYRVVRLARVAEKRMNRLGASSTRVFFSRCACAFLRPTTSHVSPQVSETQNFEPLDVLDLLQKGKVSETFAGIFIPT